MIPCYAAVIVALVVGMVSGVAIGMKASAMSLVDMLESGELVPRCDVCPRRPRT